MAGALLWLTAMSYASAQFELNFQSHSSHTGDTGVRREITSTPLHQISGTSYEFQTGQTQTPFLTEFGWNTDTGEEWQAPEIVTLNIEGANRTFYHMVLGELSTGFIQETYIEMGYAMTTTGGTFLNGVQPAQLGVSSNYASASAGDYVVTRSGGKVVAAGNGSNPLGPNAGSGTANPNRVVVLQLNNDGQLFSEFRKDSLLAKPIINQNLTSFGDIELTFSMDMSNSTYSDMSTAGVMTNKIQLFGPAVPTSQVGMPDGANFDVVAQSQNLNLTGGRYTYTAGSGGESVDHPGGSAGTYTYYDSTFDQTTIPWDQYFDATDPSGNPWSYSGARP